MCRSLKIEQTDDHSLVPGDGHLCYFLAADRFYQERVDGKICIYSKQRELVSYVICSNGSE
jgi:hypothetical protein